VIAVRDGERTIRHAVHSALTQTNPPYEVVVVDDGSADETKQRVTEMASENTIVIDGGGRGVSAARNAGIARAKGDWVAFLDGDDYWNPEFLELAIERIRTLPEAVVCFGAATPVDDDGRVVGRHDIQAVVTLEDLVCGRAVPTTSATLARRDAIVACGCFYEGFKRAAGVEDLDLWWRLAATGPCLGIQKSAATYVVHDKRDSERSAEALGDLESDRETVIDRLASRGASPTLVRRGRAIMRARTARYWLRAEQPLRARSAALASLKAQPTAEGLMTLAVTASPRSVRKALVLLRRYSRAGFPVREKTEP
jgi:glycosyltransferase involved in cell wall biosynthesis